MNWVIEMKSSVDYVSDIFNTVGERIIELEYRVEKISENTKEDLNLLAIIEIRRQ